MAAESYLREEGFTDVQITDATTLTALADGKVDMGNLFPPAYAASLEAGVRVVGLGGIGPPLAQARVSSSGIVQAAAAYQTTQGIYVAFCGNAGQSQLTALRIGASNPPTITIAWTSAENGRGSPFVTSTDGTNNVIVWGLGAENDQRLHGFDGDTGNVVFAGGGAGELMSGTRRFSTGIAAPSTWTRSRTE